MRCLVVFLLFFCSEIIVCQSNEAQLASKLAEKEKIGLELQAVNSEIEGLRLTKTIADLKALGLPSTNYIEHSAMILEYSEAHEQAAWVSHMILPQIIEGSVGRTNDFRTDPKVKTGSAVEEDYFLKYIQQDSTYEYDGYGYDRGHLAPSADFRWSKKALSESYFYSNMSPQAPEFNQKIWAELEGVLRAYVVRTKVPLYVTTLPVLNENLPKVSRSPNGLSLPAQYIKVALDPINKHGIAFLIENKAAKKLLSSYSISIDKVEELTGYNFYPNNPCKDCESTIDKLTWFPELGSGDKEPIYAPSLPRNHFNTVNGARHAGSGKIVTVCGHVVGTHLSRAGHLWLNLDKKYPNQIFSIFIRKEDIVNFSGDIEQLVMNKEYCFEGKVELIRQKPTMSIEKENNISLME